MLTCLSQGSYYRANITGMYKWIIILRNLFEFTEGDTNLRISFENTIEDLLIQDDVCVHLCVYYNNGFCIEGIEQLVVHHKQ